MTTYNDVIKAWAAKKLQQAGIVQYGIRNVSVWLTTYEEYYDTRPAVEVDIFYHPNPGKTTRRKVEFHQLDYRGVYCPEDLIEEIVESALASEQTS